jgi:hypothetical protein
MRQGKPALIITYKVVQNAKNSSWKVDLLLAVNIVLIPINKG